MKVLKVINRVFIVIGVILSLTVVLLLGGLAITYYGPSSEARDLLVTSLAESSFGKYVNYIYFSDDEIKEIRENNSVGEITDVTDTSLVDTTVDSSKPNLIIEDVYGSTFTGKMMIINDPSTVFVGVSSPSFSSAKPGKKVDEMIEYYGAVAGVNAGGFVDTGGVGNGGMPLGIVISEGKLLNGSLKSTYEVIGIDTDNKLIIGKMTGQEAIDKNIRDAVSFGPALIVNGNPLEVKGMGSGLNPRTAIGQTKDGKMLLLAINGRQANSLGASMADVIKVMLDYDAVNAANLDGGSSTVMYEGPTLINTCASLYGPRDIPTAIIVGAK